MTLAAGTKTPSSLDLIILDQFNPALSADLDQNLISTCVR